MQPMGASPFPAGREVDIVLRSGRTVHVRPVRPDDRAALQAFLEGLSDESRWTRFFGAGASMSRAARRAAEIDYVDVYGLVGLLGDEVVAHAMYARDTPEEAEVAFAVADRLHGQGLATVLLAHLVEAAAGAGVRTLTATVLPRNHAMIGVFRDCGLPVEVRPVADVIEVTMPASLAGDAHERFADRQRRATAASVAHVLAPASVAVVGPCGDPTRPGGALLRHVLGGGFAGAVHVVDPAGGEIEGRPAHRTLTALPEPPELALVVAPAEDVADVARDAAAAGVAALVVLSSGFADAGSEGASRQRELLAVCRASGMRLVGPGSAGVANPRIALNALLTPRLPGAGRVGFMSQSGALGVAVIEAAARYGVGLSSFAAAGGKADLSGNDFLEYWERDPATDVVLLYLESFGNPRRFGPVARRVGRRKPIVAVKSGRSRAGARATASRTGALVAHDAGIDALFAQAGVVRTDTMSEMLEVAGLLAHQPAPAGPRVGIVTNGGGLGVVCADACEAAGLEVAEPGPALLQAGVRENPLDVQATATPEELAAGVGAFARSGAVDAVIALAAPVFGADVEAHAGALARIAPGLPPHVTLAAVLSAPEPPDPRGPRRVPTYVFPEEAARAVGRAARYGSWRARDAQPADAPTGVDADAAAALLARALAEGDDRWLSGEDSERLVACWGLRVEAAEPAPGSVPLLVGLTADPELGPLVAAGAGGALAELVDDAAVRLAPLTAGEAARMAGELRALRSQPEAVSGVAEVLERVGALAGAHPEVAELDLDVLPGPGGATAFRVRARVRSVAPTAPGPSVQGDWA
jgi:acyl-CoA synthetase (NDP forming)/GNAT superfamily N-acetyltransferase